MSFGFPGRCVVTCWSFLGLMALVFQSAPVAIAADEDEEESPDARIERTEMFKHRARLEPKTGLRFPINDKFDVAVPFDPTNAVAGVKGALEAVERGIWLGFEFTYTEFEVGDPLSAPEGLPSDITAVGNAQTEGMMESFDRYDLLLTLDYDVELGTHVPTPEHPGPDFFSPIFTFGIGLGATVINPNESDGNPFTKFDNTYMFIARPTVGFRFPFHENVALFAEASYDFIPTIQMTGSFTPTRENVDIGGNTVDFSTFNLFFGLSFSW
jgi:hypothetical protein